MIYEYEIRKKAMKFILKQNKKYQKRILTAIYKLPLYGDISKMKGEDNIYRLRVGNCRILFELHEKAIEITVVEVTDADNRGQIYK